MEGKEKVDPIQLAVKQLMEDREKNNLDGSFVVANNEDEDNRRLLTGLLNQLETLRADGEVSEPEPAAEAEEEASSPSPVIDIVEAKRKTAIEVESVNTESGREYIIKELREVKRQNFITHCLLSVMIVLTVAWQVSEVSLILKVKDGISQPFRSFGNMITGILKGPGRNGNQRGKQLSVKQNVGVPSAFTGLKIIELAHLD